MFFCKIQRATMLIVRMRACVVQVDTSWKVLVVDNVSVRVISAACSMSEVIAHRYSMYASEFQVFWVRACSTVLHVESKLWKVNCIDANIRYVNPWIHATCAMDRYIQHLLSLFLSFCFLLTHSFTPSLRSSLSLDRCRVITHSRVRVHSLSLSCSFLITFSISPKSLPFSLSRSPSLSLSLSRSPLLFSSFSRSCSLSLSLSQTHTRSLSLPHVQTRLFSLSFSPDISFARSLSRNLSLFSLSLDNSLLLALYRACSLSVSLNLSLPRARTASLLLS